MVIDPNRVASRQRDSNHGQNRRGRTLHYYLNYSIDSQIYDYLYAAGTELLAQSGLEHGQKITLKQWDAAIVEEK